MVAVAEQQLNSFNEVKEEILERLELARQHVESLRGIVLSNVSTEETPAGVLMRESAEYLSCLDL